MTVYMLLNNKSGLFYCFGEIGGYAARWVAQEKATVWTLKIGAASARRGFPYEDKPHCEIVPFELIRKGSK